MSLTEILPLAIELPVDERFKLVLEIADSLGMEVVDLEVEKRRIEMENDPENFSLSLDQLKAELQELRNGR